VQHMFWSPYFWFVNNIELCLFRIFFVCFCMSVFFTMQCLFLSILCDLFLANPK
jgi:hypothetical protein